MKFTPYLKSLDFGIGSQSFSQDSISGIIPDSSSNKEVSIIGEFIQKIFLILQWEEILIASIDTNSESTKQLSNNSLTLIDRFSQILFLNRELGILACS